MKTKEIGLPKDRTKWTNGEWEAFELGKLATLKEVLKDIEYAEGQCSSDVCINEYVKGKIKAKIKEAEK